MNKEKHTGSVEDAAPQKPWKKLDTKALRESVEKKPDLLAKEYTTSLMLAYRVC